MMEQTQRTQRIFKKSVVNVTLHKEFEPFCWSLYVIFSWCFNYIYIMNYKQHWFKEEELILSISIVSFVFMFLLNMPITLLFKEMGCYLYNTWKKASIEVDKEIDLEIGVKINKLK